MWSKLMRLLLLLFTFNALAATFQPIPTGPVNTYGLPQTTKGSLITSSGTQMGESTVCLDGQILEWDAAETDGVKCVTPSGSVPTCTNKILGANVTVNGTAIFTFNSLVIGQEYVFTSQIEVTDTTLSDTRKRAVIVLSDGTGDPILDNYEIFELDHQSATNFGHNEFIQHKFTATSTQAVLTATTLTDSKVDANTSSATLCQASNYDATFN